ncbi:MAG: pantoate--beta-alanine ligase [Kiritimatiellia bacterium]
MIVFTTPSDMQAWALARRAGGRTLGLVPTMGFLHDGHLSLVDKARGLADLVAVSIFVNPVQFGPNEDFDRYPRDLDRDLALCEARGVDAVFAPRPSDMYAPDHSVYIDEERLGSVLCGARRPGHFRGVCTVVDKLFNIFQPTVAVFGQKDAQQAAVLRRMVRDLNIPVTIVEAPIVREADGLALSSRNTYLTPDFRRRALGLPRSLRRARALFDAGERSPAALYAEIEAILSAGCGLRVDYVTASDPDTLEPETTLKTGSLLALAAYAGDVRLIDNTRLGLPDASLDVPD